VFGGSLPATRIAVSAIDPFAVTAMRTAIAGLCSLALLIVLRRPLPPRRLWPQLAVAALGVSIMFPLLMAVGMKTVDASHGAVVLGILPIATAFVAVIITHERPKPLFWIASLVGAALVVGFSMRQSGGSLSVGDLLMFGSVASSAIGYAYSGRLTAHHAGMGSDQLGAGGGVADLAARSRVDPAGGSDAYRVEAMAGAAVRRAVFAMDRVLCVECGMAMGGITRVSQVQLLQPFVTFAIAAFFNNETITPQILLFAAAVVATVAISSRTRVRKPSIDSRRGAGSN